MTDENEYSEREILRAKLNTETSTLEIKELLPHFARGVVFKVESSLHLIDVATSFSLDEKCQVSQWLDSDEVAKASDENAMDWQNREPLFWCVVVAPWVLVQEKPGTEKGESVH